MGIYSKDYYPIMKRKPKCPPREYKPTYPCMPKRECWPVKPPHKPVNPRCHYPEYICKPVWPPKKCEKHEKKCCWESSGYAPADGWDQQSGWAPQYPWGQEQQWAPQYGWVQDQQGCWLQDQQDGWAPQDGWEQDEQDGWAPQDGAQQDGWGHGFGQSPWEGDAQSEEDGQEAAPPAQDGSTLGAIRSAIMDQLDQLGIQVDEPNFLSDLWRLSEKELFALLGLLGLLGFFVLLGFLSAEDLAVE